MAMPAVAQKVDSVAAPIEQGYRSLMGELRDKNAVGVVVAVNGQIVWADIFASTDLLQRYWPKLVRSYAAEAVVSNTKWSDAGEKTRRRSSIVWQAAIRPWKASRVYIGKRN